MTKLVWGWEAAKPKSCWPRRSIWVIPENASSNKRVEFQIAATKRFPEVLVCQIPFTEKKPRHEIRRPKALLLLNTEAESASANQSMRSALGVDFGTAGTSIYRARVLARGSMSELKTLSHRV